MTTRNGLLMRRSDLCCGLGSNGDAEYAYSFSGTCSWASMGAQSLSVATYTHTGSCAASSVSPPPPRPQNVGCFGDRGTTYDGEAHTTVNGRTCQAWALDTPHAHNYNHLPENYCRNPDNEPGPWCYTIDPNTVSYTHLTLPTKRIV